jgi:autotransporter-associated beta strand protein
MIKHTPNQHDATPERGGLFRIDPVSKSLLLTYLGLLAVQFPNEAAAETWIGPNNGAWFDQAHWQGGQVPNASTLLTDVSNGTTSIIDEGAADAGSTLTIANPNSKVSILSGGSLTTGAVGLSAGGALDVGNSVSHGNLTGNVHLNNGFLNFNSPTGSATTFSGTITGNALTDAAYCAPGLVNGCSGLNASSGTLVLTGANTLNGWVGVKDGAMLRLANPNALQNGVVLLSPNGTLDLNGLNATLGGLHDSLGGSGNLNLGSTTLTLGNGQAPNAVWGYSGIISGAGGLIKTGSGTQMLTGANTYGGGTTVNGGILAGNAVSLQGDIVNNAQVWFSQTGNGAYAGAMSGTGSLVKDGAGTLTLAGANTYSGGTFVSAGTLAGDTASLQGDIVNNAQVRFNQSSDGAYAGAMSGTGSLIKDGAGALALTGANTYSGGTFVNAGTLAGDTASLQGDIVNNARVLFSQTTDGTYAGRMAGTGSLVKDGAGILALIGANTYSGGTFVSAGTLAGTTASLQGDIVNNAQVLFNQSSDGAYAGAMSGTGGLIKGGPGILALTGTNTYNGATQVGNGTLAVTGSLKSSGPLLVGSAADGSGTVTLDSTGTLAVGSETVGYLGNGTFNQNGGTHTVAGSLVLGQNSGVTGTYNLAGGQLAVGQQLLVGTDGGGAGVLNVSGGQVQAGEIVNRGVFNYSGGPVTANLTNLGAVNLGDTGQRVIDGNVVNQGSFNVNYTSAAYTGTFTNNGAYVGNASTHQFGNLTIGANGYLVGGAQDRFIVTGDFLNASTQKTLWNTSRSALVFSGAPSTQHLMQLAGAKGGARAKDFRNNFSWGSVTLSSGNGLRLASGNPRNTDAALYVRRLVLPNGLQQLNNIDSNHNVYYDPTVAANRYLFGHTDFGSGTGRLLPWGSLPQMAAAAESFGLSSNQLNFAAALDQACTSPTGALTARCMELQTLTPAGKKQAIVQLTPDQVPSQTGIGIQFRATRMDVPLARLYRLRHGTIEPLALNFNGVELMPQKAAAVSGSPIAGGGGGAGDDTETPSASEEPFRDSPLGVYLQTRFNIGDMRQNPWDSGYHFEDRNITVGADYRFTDRLVAGAMFNYINTEAHYNDARGRLDTDSFLGMIYGSYYLPMDFYVDWAAHYGGHDHSFSRQFQYGEFSGQTRSKPNAEQYGFTLSLGKDIAWQEWLFSPYTRFEYTNLSVDAYRERGGSGFDLAVDKQNAYSFVSDLGTQISYNLSLPWGVVTPAIRVEWEHQYLNNNRQIGIRLLDTAPGLGNFVIQTGGPDRDYINLGGSISATLPNNGAAFLRYETRLGQSNISQHIVEAGVRITF